MNNDCYTNCSHASIQFYIKADFAKSLRIQSSLIGITVSHKLVRTSNNEAMPGVIETINNSKELLISSRETVIAKKEINADVKEIASDMRINTTSHQGSEIQHSWKCELTLVEIPADIKETSFDIVALRSDIRGNAIVHRVNTHQHWWKSELTVKHCHLTSKKCMTILRKQVTEVVQLALNTKNYDTNIAFLAYTWRPS